MASRLKKILNLKNHHMHLI